MLKSTHYVLGNDVYTTPEAIYYAANRGLTPASRPRPFLSPETGRYVSGMDFAGLGYYTDNVCSLMKSVPDKPFEVAMKPDE